MTLHKYSSYFFVNTTTYIHKCSSSSISSTIYLHKCSSLSFFSVFTTTIHPRRRRLVQFPTRLARQLSELSTNSFVSPPPSNPSTPQQQSGPPDFGSYYGSRSVASRRTPVQSPEVMPDAVLNMAAKGGPEKKPWSYAPNTDMLQEQRNRVRRK